MDKKKISNLKIILIIFGVLILGVIVIRSLSDEDTWICDKGIWVKHGNPSRSMPSQECSK